MVNKYKKVKLCPDDAFLRSINHMRLKACCNLRSACDIAYGFSWILEAHDASKGFPLQLESRAILNLRSFVIFDLKKKITLNYTDNYKKRSRPFGNMTLKIIRITYWDEIPSKILIWRKKYKFEDFSCWAVYLWKFYSIFYSNICKP